MAVTKEVAKKRQRALQWYYDHKERSQRTTKRWQKTHRSRYLAYQRAYNRYRR